MGKLKTAIAPLTAAVLVVIVAGLLALAPAPGFGAATAAVFADTEAVPVAAPPAAVANLTAAPGTTAGTATLAWTPSDGANIYWVAGILQRDLDAKDFGNLIWEAADREHTHQLTDLEPGADYLFTVAAGRRTGTGSAAVTVWGSWAPTVTLTAPAVDANGPPPPSPPALTAAELRRRVRPALARVSYRTTVIENGVATEYLIAGTAFVVNPQGLMVTNRHVIGGQQSVTARLELPAGGVREYPARVLGRGIVTDLAVLQLPPPPAGSAYPSLPLGDSDAVNLLDEVTLWGYPYGDSLGILPSVTKGVISSRERIFEDTEYLQTDAAINVGNSGGPMVDRYGQVIGVVAATVSGSENIGLAIAVNELSDRLEILTRGGPAQATYRNLRHNRGYRVDIPAGWYLDGESRRCSAFDQYAGFGDASLCAYDLDGRFPEDDDRLAAFAEERWQRLREFDTDPISFRRIDRNGRAYYRLEYNLLDGSDNCDVEHRIMLVGLSGSYAERPYGFTWRVGLCESGRSRYDGQRKGMLDSFVP